MLIRNKDEISKTNTTIFNIYFTRTFLIKPFICKKCGNMFMLEYGVISEGDYSYREGFTCRSELHRGDKFCDICGKDIEKMYEKDPTLNPGVIARWVVEGNKKD